MFAQFSITQSEHVSLVSWFDPGEIQFSSVQTSGVKFIQFINKAHNSIMVALKGLLIIVGLNGITT